MLNYKGVGTIVKSVNIDYFGLIYKYMERGLLKCDRSR